MGTGSGKRPGCEQYPAYGSFIFPHIYIPRKMNTGLLWTTDIRGGCLGQPQMEVAVLPLGTAENCPPGQERGISLRSRDAFPRKSQSFPNTGLKADSKRLKSHFRRNNINECSTISGNKRESQIKVWEADVGSAQKETEQLRGGAKGASLWAAPALLPHPSCTPHPTKGTAQAPAAEPPCSCKAKNHPEAQPDPAEGLSCHKSCPGKALDVLPVPWGPPLPFLGSPSHSILGSTRSSRRVMAVRG